jgi:hypothetical protein
MSAQQYGWFKRPRCTDDPGKRNKIAATQNANVRGTDNFDPDPTLRELSKSCLRVSADKLRADPFASEQRLLLISIIF